jgi:hypothetical protein
MGATQGNKKKQNIKNAEDSGQIPDCVETVSLLTDFY